MPRFSRKPPRKDPPPTFLCRNRAEVTRALAAIREHLGLSQLDLDDLAGFSTGYTGKLEAAGAPAKPGERPSGRNAIHSMFDIWLASLGVELLVVPAGHEPDLSQASPPAWRAPRMSWTQAEKMRALHRAGRSRNSLYRLFRCTPKLVDDILEGRVLNAKKIK